MTEENLENNELYNKYKDAEYTKEQLDLINSHTYTKINMIDDNEIRNVRFVIVSAGTYNAIDMAEQLKTRFNTVESNYAKFFHPRGEWIKTIHGMQIDFDENNFILLDSFEHFAFKQGPYPIMTVEEAIDHAEKYKGSIQGRKYGL